MNGIIYKITHTQSGKAYIGLTINGLEYRWEGHQQSAKTGSNFEFHIAIRKYGADAFTIEILALTTIEDMRSEETRYIAKYDTFHNGYNMNKGGGGCHEHTPETKAKMAASKMGKKHTAESKAKMAASKTGKKHTAESKAKMAASAMGNTNSADPTVHMIVKFYTIFLSKIFYGTQQEMLAEFPEMTRAGLNHMLLSKVKTHKGWMLPATAMNPPASVRIHTIENQEHDDDSGTVRQLLEKHPEMKPAGLGQMLSGKLQTHKGWSLKKNNA
jgi:group I intron endonuclease